MKAQVTAYLISIVFLSGGATVKHHEIQSEKEKNQKLSEKIAFIENSVKVVHDTVLVLDKVYVHDTFVIEKPPKIVYVAKQVTDSIYTSGDVFFDTSRKTAYLPFSHVNKKVAIKDTNLPVHRHIDHSKIKMK